jgi:hypothetical protein
MPWVTSIRIKVAVPQITDLRTRFGTTAVPHPSPAPNQAHPPQTQPGHQQAALYLDTAEAEDRVWPKTRQMASLASSAAPSAATGSERDTNGCATKKAST